MWPIDPAIRRCARVTNGASHSCEPLAYVSCKNPMHSTVAMPREPATAKSKYVRSRLFSSFWSKCLAYVTGRYLSTSSKPPAIMNENKIIRSQFCHVPASSARRERSSTDMPSTVPRRNSVQYSGAESPMMTETSTRYARSCATPRIVVPPILTTR